MLAVEAGGVPVANETRIEAEVWFVQASDDRPSPIRFGEHLALATCQMRVVESLWAAALSASTLACGVSGAATAPRPEPAGSHTGGGARLDGQLSRLYRRDQLYHYADPARTGEQIYRTTCAGCHGIAGSGALPSTVGFAVPLPDFTDCNFATREQEADWTAIVRDGGPVRGFSRIMPAFRDLLTPEQIQNVIAYIHTFCQDRSWPRGEFNLPLAQSTEKAFPEDEFVLTGAVNTRGPGSVSNHLIYEKRFGSRDQLEVDVPFGFVDRPGEASWTAGLGDLSLGPKHVFISSLASGTILSGAAGVVLPTGDRAKGFGTGTTAFEGYALLGQLLPARSFFQFQSGVELPTDLSRAERSAFWRGALGTTVSVGPISRIWSPMLEVTGERDLVSGAPVAWDMVPQFQVSLSALQHVRANLGVSIPLTETGTRHPQILAYVLWDVFDGPLFQGWKGWCPGCQH